MGQGRQACLGMPLCMFGTGIIGIMYLISEGKNESHVVMSESYLIPCD